MKVNTETLRFAINRKLLLFIEKKLSKLDNFYDHIICADIYLKV